MNQSKLGSLIESTVNTLIGFIVSFVAWPIAAFIFSVDYNSYQHFGLVLFFTVVSVLRGYAVRRFFNARLHSASLVIAGKISNEP